MLRANRACAGRAVMERSTSAAFTSVVQKRRETSRRRLIPSLKTGVKSECANDRLDGRIGG